MSVRETTYLLYGLILPYKAFNKFHGGDAYEKCEPFDADDVTIPGPAAIFDGMMGEFVAVGYIQAASDRAGHFPKPVTIPMPLPDEVHRGALKVMSALQVPQVVATLPENPRLGWHIIPQWRRR